MIEKTATKALIAPRPSNSPERLPPEKIEPTSDNNPPPAFVQMAIIRTIITT